jgi:hypothetical protein
MHRPESCTLAESTRFAWLIFNTIRRYKIAKLQAEMQTKLLEKLGSGQELLAYAQTETGRELLESLKVERIALTDESSNHRRAANRNYSSLCRRSSCCCTVMCPSLTKASSSSAH